MISRIIRFSHFLQFCIQEILDNEIMHRITSLPGDESIPTDLEIIEQPKAPVLFLTTANTDITTISGFLKTANGRKWKGLIKALQISKLFHPAQIDHYLFTTASESKIIILRLLGGKEHWSYGLEQLKIWQEMDETRILIILSGIKENEEELNELSTLSIEVNKELSSLLRIGGLRNIELFLEYIHQLYLGEKNSIIDLNKIERINDPLKWDWLNENNPKIGIILYSSSYQSNDIELAEKLTSELRKNNLTPRLLWVSNLKDRRVQKEVLRIYQKEKVYSVITSTSFSTVSFDEHFMGNTIWDELNVPIFQVLISGKSKKIWKKSTRGLDTIDFSIQVVLPELDGRINTQIVAFRESEERNEILSTMITKAKPYNEGIRWLVEHIKSWTDLSIKDNKDKKIAIIMSNYPNKDGRLGNGVGLDTPESIVNIIKWLSNNNFSIKKSDIPKNGNELISLILKTRTNSQESKSKRPLDYLDLNEYLTFWRSLPDNSCKNIVEKWGLPNESLELENDSFPIHGIKLGNICILIQPARGYNEDNINDIHSPYLPPSHRYLAQYLWLRINFMANSIIHVGKHGTLEWLPGKSVGTSEECFPRIVLPPLPYIYPFIVNDPGEGSQAKRRTNSVIIDHLTPPLSKAELHGELLEIENLIEEYYSSEEFESDRKDIIKNRLCKIFSEINLNNLKSLKTSKTDISFLDKVNSVESYLCELKESQIRTGLHIFGSNLDKKNIKELTTSIAEASSIGKIGISQSIIQYLGLKIDPDTDEIELKEARQDIITINKLTGLKLNSKLEILDFVNKITSFTIEFIINEKELDSNDNSIERAIALKFIDDKDNSTLIDRIKVDIFYKLKASPSNEISSLLKALNGTRVSAGPSGAPTRGKNEVLPTGRNFFSVDLRGLPTEASWDLGRRSALKLLDLFLQDNGTHLKNLAISVWGTSTMRNGGEDIGQIFYLMGVKPIWNSPSRRVVDLEVIPLSILQRPRVDITIRISGLFRDAFPQLIEMLNKAIEIISNLNESDEDNNLAKEKKAGKSTSRIFGSAPETYGTGLQELLDLGNWNARSDLAKKYLSWSSYSYKNINNPIFEDETLKHNLSNIQAIIHNQDNREHDIFDSDDYYQFHGGLSCAVEYLSKKEASIYFGDNSKYQIPKVHELSKEIDKVVRSRLLNPKWINGMMKHGYKGAFEFSASLDYLFSYDATTNLVPDWCYRSINNSWLKSPEVKNFIDQNNPWVLRDMAERLLEASNRGLWKDITTTEKKELTQLILSTERRIESLNYENSELNTYLDNKDNP